MPRLGWILLACLAVPLRAQGRSTPLDTADGRVIFAISEASRDTLVAPSTYLSYRTERVYGCLLPLYAKLRTAAGGITLDSLAVGFGDLCPAALGPATGRTRLPLEAGAQLLIIRARGIEDRYVIDLDAQRILIRPQAPPRISVSLESVLLRFPPNSFAVRCSNEAPSWICDGALRTVLAVNGIAPIDMPRVGRNPYTGGRDLAEWGIPRVARDTVPEPRAPLRVFRYASPDVLQRLRAALRAYRAQLASPVTFSAVTWTGISP